MICITKAISMIGLTLLLFNHDSFSESTVHTHVYLFVKFTKMTLVILLMQPILLGSSYNTILIH